MPKIGFFRVRIGSLCPFKEENSPGMHPDLRRKMSDYKKRLMEKQKLRFSYWVSEKQFRNYVKEAFKKPGIRAKRSSVFLNVDWTMLFIASGLLDASVSKTVGCSRHVLVNAERSIVPLTP